MLEQIDLSKKMSKEEYKRRKKELSESLCEKQRLLWEAKVPAMVVFEGFDLAGKGSIINELILPMTPKAFQVHPRIDDNDENIERPYLWRYFTQIPEKGRLDIFVEGWYERLIQDRFYGMVEDDEFSEIVKETNSFEKMMTDDGALVIKFMLFISKKEQKKRLKARKENDLWTDEVVFKDIKRKNKYYKDFLTIADEAILSTDTENAPWIIVECEDKRYGIIKVMESVDRIFTQKLKSIEIAKKPEVNGLFVEGDRYDLRALSGIDLTKKLTREEYKEKESRLKKELFVLQNAVAAIGIPVVLGFEGWDAAGKGGAIHRLTEALDPRRYRVNPTSSPNDTEKAHQYLWRFWKAMPKDGEIAIFDRTWYGRVMVERIEGFCSINEWQRAYREINEMELQLANHGAIVIKFWLQIDKDEQEKRFNDRMNTPGKEWKITDEDWRNREKWPLYEQAVDEMLIKTSTPYAPWVIVEGNDKYYARIKVLETVAKAIKDRISEIAGEDFLKAILKEKP